MTKTPEQLAEEYCEDHDECEFAREAFLAGYQAAKVEYKDAMSAYKDVAKQMLEEAVRIMSPKDQLADGDKVMPNQDGDLLHKVANDYLDMKAARYRRVCGYKK